MKKKWLFLLVTVAMFAFLTACGDKNDNGNKGKDKDEGAASNSAEEVKKTGFPIVDDEVTIKIFARQDPATADNWNDVMIFNEYEKMTNVNVEWEMVPQASVNEKRNLSLAGGTLPDAYHTTFMPVSDIQKYGDQGAFIPLNDLIEEYAPNFKKILDENPDVRGALTFPDGNIYSLPTLRDPDFIAHRTAAHPFINKEWLDNLGLDEPETLDDYYEFLKAVKEGDPNGNGENDEIPFGATHANHLIEYLRGSFGLGNRGTGNAHIDVEPDNEDQVRFIPTADEYKELLEYINKLFEEELIEQNIFSIEHDQYLANGSEGKYGSTIWYSPDRAFSEEAGEPYIGMKALKGPHGDDMYSHHSPPTAAIGSFIITSANEHPEATMRWIDYFYGDDGAKLFFMGIEGETFEVNDDGELEYMDHITNSKDGLTRAQEISKYLTFGGGGFPALITQDYFTGAEATEKTLDAAEKIKDQLPDPWATFLYTKEESDKLDRVGKDIEKYVEESTDKFIAGELPFSEWDKYVETIEKMGLDEYMQIQQEAYERYQDN